VRKALVKYPVGELLGKGGNNKIYLRKLSYVVELYQIGLLC
jgi:hypothetical protein